MRAIGVNDKTSFQLPSTGIAGAIASLLTQPLEVIKTNRINSPALLYGDIHKKIVKDGWTQYMRGSSIAVIRQAYGFTLYTQMLSRFENHFSKTYPSTNKFIKYSLSAVPAKLAAMIFEAPLSLLKTRVECMNSNSILEEVKYIMKRPTQEYAKGLGSSLGREAIYTLFHYSTYRYLKDDLFKQKLQQDMTFLPAFIAGVVAITVSQPFEVLRSQVSLNKGNESVIMLTSRCFRQFGLKGFFFGYVPRLVRKPINSGICWSVVQALRQIQ